jgi:hypothetical protein
MRIAGLFLKKLRKFNYLQVQGGFGTMSVSRTIAWAQARAALVVEDSVSLAESY